MDTKREIVLELALEYHCVVLPERCPKDDYPLAMFSGDERKWCLIEIKKNELAQQDRSKLVVYMKMNALNAIVKSQAKIKIEPQKPRDLRFYEPEITLGKLIEWVNRHQHHFAKMPTDEIAKQALACGFKPRDIAIWKLRQMQSRAA